MRAFLTVFVLWLGCVSVHADVNILNSYRFGGSTSSLPANLQVGLQLDFDASKLPGAHNSNITTAVDESGKGHNMTNSGTAPKVWSWNGRKRLLCQGGALVTTSFLDSTFNTAFTYFVISEPTSGNDGGRIMGDVNQVAFFDIESGNRAGFYKIGLSGAYHYSPTDANTYRNLDVYRYDGATQTMRRNAAQNTGSITGNLGLTGAFYIGNFSTGGYDFFGYIDRTLVYNRALTDQEILDVEASIGFALPAPGAHSSGGGTTKVVCDGNSMTLGTGGTAYPTQLATLLGGGYAITNLGIGGQTTPTMSKNSYANVDALFTPTAAKNICVVWEGTNDLRVNAGSINSAKAYAHLVDYCKGRQAAGYQVIILTILPRSESSPYAGFEADRIAANTLIRTNYASFADGIYDCALDGRIGDAGDETNTTYYIDLVHMTTAGYAIIAAGVNAAILALP